jgi:hypothetical protein
MAVKTELNNIGNGTSITTDFQDVRGSRGTITSYITTGAADAAAIAALSLTPSYVQFPGTTIPPKYKTVQKLDGGRALVVETFQRNPNQIVPPSWSTLLSNSRLTSYPIEWWGDAPSAVPADGDIVTTGYNAAGFEYPSTERMNQAGINSWIYNPECYDIVIPTVLTADVRTNANYISMIGTCNNASFGIFPLTYTKRTLVFKGANVDFYQTPSGVQFYTWYFFQARRDGHYAKFPFTLGATTPWTAAYKYRLLYPESNFNALPYFV